jgi:thiol:disulfide interchange protein
MFDKPSQPQSPPESRAGSPPPIASRLYRRRWAIVWLVALALILLVQWPLFKGLFYRFTGSAAPDDGIPWRTDFAAALAESRQAGKPVLLDFWATWCPPCQAMKHDVWPDPQVRQILTASYIPVAIDVDAAATRNLSQRYRITNIPSILIVDADGNVRRQAGYMTRSSLLRFLAEKPQ